MRIALVLVALLVVGVPAAAQWPTFHANERHTGFQAGTKYVPYEEVWWTSKIDPATRVEGSPVVSQGLLVFAGWDGIVRVHDAASGAQKWTATMTKIVGTPVITTGGRLFVVDTAGTLNAYDLKSGLLLDTVAVGATQSSPTISEGKVFIGNEAGVMQAFDTETLTLLWTFNIGTVAESTTTSCTTATPPVCTVSCGTLIPAQGIRGSPVVYGGKVIFGSLNHWVFALDEKGQSGQKTTPQWIFKTSDAVFGSPSIDTANGRVLIGSYDEKVYAMPASPSGSGPLTTGASATPCSAYRNTATWTFTVPSSVGLSKVQSTPAIDANNAYFGANNGNVYAVTLASGTKVWEAGTSGAVISSPAVSNNVVVTGSDDGNVYWFNAANGTQLAKFSSDSAIKSSVALDGDKTYVASFEGSMHMLGPKIPTRADLAVSGISYSGGALAITVENRGNAGSAACKLRISVDGAFLADVDVPAIAAGGSTTVAHTTDLVGTHNVTAAVDQESSVAESQEGNNQLMQAVTAVEDEPESKGKGGSGIPGPGLPVLLGALAVALLARRRPSA